MIRINRGHPLSVGLRNWWLMSPSDLGPGGSVLDIARSSRNVTAGNTPQAGPHWGRSSLAFPTKFTLPDAPTLVSPFSISCWVKPGVLTRGDLITRWDTGGAAGDQFDLLYGLSGTGKPQFYVADGSATTAFTAEGSGAMAVGQWHHVVATVAGTALSCYLDGVLQGTGTGTTNPSPTAVLMFGDNSSATPAFNAPFSGSMSDVAIWARCLSAAEVAQLYAISRVGYPGMLIPDRSPPRPNQPGRFRRLGVEGGFPAYAGGF